MQAEHLKASYHRPLLLLAGHATYSSDMMSSLPHIQLSSTAQPAAAAITISDLTTALQQHTTTFGHHHSW